MIRRELAGRRILVTRAADDADHWAARLAAVGALPVTLPCLICEPITDDATVRRLRDAINEADWLLLTSARGAHAVARLLRGGPAGRTPTRVPTQLRIAAVGPATARAATRRLGRVDLVAGENTAKGLADELAATIRDAPPTRPVRVVIAAAAGGRDDAAAVLGAAGVAVLQVAVYRTVPAPAVRNKRDLAADGVEIVLLASPSAVTGLLRLVVLPTSARIITIGPTTSTAATAAGLVVAGEAKRPTFEGILEAIL
jgi:uroporphyrinogen-III synthase